MQFKVKWYIQLDKSVSLNKGVVTRHEEYGVTARVQLGILSTVTCFGGFLVFLVLKDTVCCYFLKSFQQCFILL